MVNLALEQLLEIIRDCPIEKAREEMIEDAINLQDLIYKKQVESLEERQKLKQLQKNKIVQMYLDSLPSTLLDTPISQLVINSNQETLKSSKKLPTFKFQTNQKENENRLNFSQNKHHNHNKDINDIFAKSALLHKGKPTHLPLGELNQNLYRSEFGGNRNCSQKKKNRFKDIHFDQHHDSDLKIWR